MKGIHWVAIIAIIAVTTLVGLSMNDEPTVGESLQNTAEDLSDGIEDTAEEFDKNRTPAERFGDTIEDAGEDIQDTVE